MRIRGLIDALSGVFCVDICVAGNKANFRSDRIVGYQDIYTQDDLSEWGVLQHAIVV
jgi:hypothetical protein